MFTIIDRTISLRHLIVRTVFWLARYSRCVTPFAVDVFGFAEFSINDRMPRTAHYRIRCSILPSTWREKYSYWFVCFHAENSERWLLPQFLDACNSCGLKVYICHGHKWFTISNHWFLYLLFVCSSRTTSYVHVAVRMSSEFWCSYFLRIGCSCRITIRPRALNRTNSCSRYCVRYSSLWARQ